ncbi:MAG TPA: DUF4386 domain-containing protein [Pyrinomonadaceae bacterium]|nr:DUF4386 domain-containing protein [Pyrinomonadaceae bacterium]
MTNKANARLAGFAFLFYIATGISSLVLFNQAAGGGSAAAKLASIVQHAGLVRVTVLLNLCGFLSAVVLGVTLYALTRDEDRELALLGLCCRLTEGVNAVVAATGRLQLLSLATIATGSTAATQETVTAQALGALEFRSGGWTGNISAICFALGSTLFAYLFVRSRSIPAPLAWLGLFASLLLLVTLPIGLVGAIDIPFLVWIPMLVFELAFAVWLIVKGVAPAGRRLEPSPAS